MSPTKAVELASEHSTQPEHQYSQKISYFRSTSFQILLVGAVTFIAPGLWNAMNSLGAGGALEPYLVNAGNSIVFGFMGLFCILSPVLVNSIGVRYTLVLGTIGYPVYAAALYQNNRYGTEWFVIFGAVINGISAGMYWAAEGAIVLAYPEHRKRGRYLAIWSAFKNMGQVVGGAINLALNAKSSTGGKVSYTTLLVFVILQVLGFPLAFLISSPEKVQREDRTPVRVEKRTSTLTQLKILAKAVKTKDQACLLPLFFSSWFYWGYASTFLTLYFSVRARALGSFLSAISQASANALLGLYLDSQRLSVKARARSAGAFVMTLFSGILIWAVVIQHAYIQQSPGKLDWLSPGFGRGFGMYLMLNIAGGLVQNYLYWSVGSLRDGTNELTRATGLLRGIESWGQCASFGISSSKFNPLYTVVINVVFWAISFPIAWFSLSEIGKSEHVHDEETTASRSDTEFEDKNSHN